MRCSEACRRLTESRGTVSSADTDLRDHLAACPACAEFARAERMLVRDLSLSTADDTEADRSFAAMRARVNARAEAITSQTPREVFIMSALKRTISRRPRMSLTIATAVIVLAFLTVVPFSFQRTVGYEVAIAGVNKDLAMDDAKITELLAALGVENAAVNVGDCEKTCVLNISDLKSQDDVVIIKTAFDKMGHCVVERVGEIADTVTASLISQLQYTYQFKTEKSDADEDEITIYVSDCLAHLSTDGDSMFSIWISADSCGIPLDSACCDSAVKIYIMDAEMGEVGNWIPEGTKPPLEIMQHSDGGHKLIFMDENGNKQEIDLSAEDVQQQLSELGITWEEINSGDGVKKAMYYTQGCQPVTVEMLGDNGDIDDAAKATDQMPALPEGFELKQNHPNPFNPTTQIEFTLPESGHVKLDIYNVSGQKIASLIDAHMSAGEHTVTWNATDDSGGRVASGVYLYRLTAGQYTTSKKMTLLK